ncbi:MAG: hypothetical protein AB7E63_09500 [Parachlamydia sp.]|jgi:hypothetical protein|uniref:hypothetical protein n=1 Tax=Parachlamydia acanthamoebae TaxID=83552 RepID=UPI0024E26DB5|nr:hypothetical protein [Parachlamydia acanthamoebae]
MSFENFCTFCVASLGQYPYIELKISKHTLTGRWSSSDATALSEEGINNAERIAKMFKTLAFA